MQFLIKMYWTSLMGNHFSQPNFTDIVRVTESIVQVHYSKKKARQGEEYEREHKARHEEIAAQLRKFNDKTNDDVDFPLPSVEFLVFNNWRKSPDAMVTVRSKEIEIHKLFAALNDLLMETTRIVTDIAMNYSMDIEYSGGLFSGGKGGGKTFDALSLGKRRDKDKDKDNEDD